MSMAVRRSMSRATTLMRHLRPSAVAGATAVARRGLAASAARAAATSAGGAGAPARPAASGSSAAASSGPKRFSRLVRFLDESGAERFGDQTHEKGRIVTRVLSGSPFGEYTIGSEEIEPAKYLSPLGAAHTPQIIGIGLNYRKHAVESKLAIPQFPVMFNKNISTLNDPYAAIVVPRTPSHPAPCEVDYEVELAVVIGKAAKNVSEADALKYVLGYTVANDVTCRKWQFVSGPNTQWNRGKSFDTFTPLGPALVNAALIPNPNALALQTVLNGRAVQNSNTSDMIFTVQQIIAYCSESTTLAPGTVILTGTPEGVGMGMSPPRYMKPGDEVAVAVEKIGQLRNFVTA